MIPKSLHTITAIARVASHLMGIDFEGLGDDPEAACVHAARILGYDVSEDSYGLIDKAYMAMTRPAKGVK